MSPLTPKMGTERTIATFLVAVEFFERLLRHKYSI